MWSAAQRQKIYGLDVHVGFELNHRSDCCGKQCSFVRSCVEERGWSCLEVIRF